MFDDQRFFRSTIEFRWIFEVCQKKRDRFRWIFRFSQKRLIWILIFRAAQNLDRFYFSETNALCEILFFLTQSVCGKHVLWQLVVFILLAWQQHTINGDKKSRELPGRRVAENTSSATIAVYTLLAWRGSWPVSKLEKSTVPQTSGGDTCRPDRPSTVMTMDRIRT